MINVANTADRQKTNLNRTNESNSNQEAKFQIRGKKEMLQTVNFDDKESTEISLVCLMNYTDKDPITDCQMFPNLSKRKPLHLSCAAGGWFSIVCSVVNFRGCTFSNSSLSTKASL